MKSYDRTDYCGSLSEKDVGRQVTVCGWVSRMRDLGGLIFIDLRDREGIIQCVFDSAANPENFDAAFSVRAEFVVLITGTLRVRGGAKNERLSTGTVEIAAADIKILNRSDTPPFEITDETDVNAELRLKYRYLDLRRAPLQRALRMRHRIAKLARDYFDYNGFLEIETPILTKSTPEGARDYLVPSRVHPGEFYALPQSPQQYKQLLMLSGFDRYMQIARCFRDEDLRADRQPEFTQIDLEMSFVDIGDVIEINEGFIKKLFSDILGVTLETPFARMSYDDAMDLYGSDKPDLRFDMRLHDLTPVAQKCGFKVFSDISNGGGTVRALNAKAAAARFSRKDIDAVGEFVKTYRAKGLAWVKSAGGEISSSFSKFMTASEMDEIYRITGFEDGDILFVVADLSPATAKTALGALRCELARRLDLIRPDVYRFLWVVDFPLFEYDGDAGRFVAMHHPFTAPRDADIPLFEKDPAKMKAKAYDIILNGTELGGGSIRIFSQQLQRKMFSAIGLSAEEASCRFGHLLEAFRYGAPPHGGMAYGLDRLCMLMSGFESIREVIAFPKVQNASELMTGCPSSVDRQQLDELGLCLASPQPNA